MEWETPQLYGLSLSETGEGGCAAGASAGAACLAGVSAGDEAEGSIDFSVGVCTMGSGA